MGLNAQTSVPVFTAGNVLTAQQQKEINTGIPVFATTVTRDAAFGATGEKTLAEGQFCYLEDTNRTQYYDGAAWQSLVVAETGSYTPTFTNWTIGNGTFFSSYVQVGKLVTVNFKFTAGSTSAFGAIPPKFTYPITGLSTWNTQAQIGSVTFYDVSTGQLYVGQLVQDSATTIQLLGLDVASTRLVWGYWSSTQPVAMGTGDLISGQFTYEAA